MAGMTCDVCGGKVVASSDHEGWFVCENCGTEYPLEWMKAKFQETQTVKVEGNVQVEGIASAENLYQRALLFLEQGDFNNATVYFDKVLDIDAGYAPAYVGKLAAKCQMKSESELVNAKRALVEYTDYNLAFRFADDNYKVVLQGYAEKVMRRLLIERISAIAKEKRRKTEREIEEARRQEKLQAEERKRKEAEDAERRVLEAERRALKEMLSSFSRFGDSALERKMRSRLEEKLDKGCRTLGYKWRALGLDRGSNAALVTTSECVAQKSLSEKCNLDEQESWRQCSLPDWLNGTFVASLPFFIQEIIIKPPYYFTSLMNDMVFCLSVEEADSLFPSKESRATTYDGAITTWWLRSPGGFAGYFARVGSDGSIDDEGINRTWRAGVRPAMWVKID
ncbi:MAG: DUF6273 domain-containing protein [Coriobacteriia bacterium]|nr:DUF6273 domain-containing protein [Coriobacteriia bacterium]